MFNMGVTEIIIIGALALMIFGPDKLPQLARTIGKGLTDLRRTTNDLKRTVKDEFEAVSKENDLDTLKDIKDIQSGFQGIKKNSLTGYLESATDILDKKDQDSPKDKS